MSAKPKRTEPPKAEAAKPAPQETAAAKPKPAVQKEANATPPPASNATINGAQPVVPAGNFDSRWGGLQ